MAFTKSVAASRLVMPIALATLTSLSMANAYEFSRDDLDWVNASPEQIEEHLEGLDLSAFEEGANPHTEAMKKEAAKVPQGDVQMQRLKAEKKSQQVYEGHDTLIFASMSLEHTGLDDILAVASEDPSVAVVFRGVPEGMQIDEGIYYYQSFASQYDDIPNVMLDPSLFDKYDVETVPTIVQLSPEEAPALDIPDAGTLMAGDMDAVNDALEAPAPTKEAWNREVLARVSGLTDPAWLERQIEAGRSGDLGIKGPVEAIKERHLIELMKERAMGVDWASQKQGAIDRFWFKQRDNFHFLPPATQDRTRRIDASVIVTEDILDAEGNVLVAQGTRINPMDAMPFDMGLVIFDPLDESQLEAAYLASRELEERDDIREVMLIATRFNADEGWDGFKEATDYFDRHVFLLQPEIKTRFELEYIPSVVTGDDTHFIVEELAIKRAQTSAEQAAIAQALERMSNATQE